MNASAPSGLGDVVRAYAALRPDEETAGRIARLLGLELPERQRPRGPTTELPRSTRGPSLPTGTRRPLTRPTEKGASTRREDTNDDDPTRTTPWRRYLRPTGRTAPSREGGAQGLPAWVATSSVADPLPPRESLLHSRTAPRVLESLVATDVPDGDVDVDRVIAALAARRRLTTVPLGSRRSLLRGVQVLADVSEVMAPYTDDCDHVVAVLRATVGRAHVEHLVFDGSPAQGAGTGSVWAWGRYVPPPPGTPVLALTELGLAAVPSRLPGELEDSWLDTHEMLRRRGSPLVVLTPFHPSRWPARLARTVELVHWDRSCTVSTVHRLVRGRSARGTGAA